MAVSKITTLLIDDSGFMRILLSDFLRRDEDINVIATASNGREGVEKARALHPDVVITDMMMPEFDGLYVVNQLMKVMPVPIILMSSLTRADSRIFDALKEGAFDFIDKPRENRIMDGYFPLIKMVHEASRVDFSKLKQRKKKGNTSSHKFRHAQSRYDVIAIGSSTGGPSAIEYILDNLPANLTVPVVIAQHMPDRFIESFAARLADMMQLKISVARDGEPLRQNHIYMAPGIANIKISNQGSGPIVQYVYDQYREFNDPSIDCLFESLADNFGDRAIGVILTGMGRDGVNGLKKIREAGGLTLAQDKDTSIVFGMPKAAFESGAAMHQIPLTEIPNFIISAL